MRTRPVAAAVAAVLGALERCRLFRQQQHKNEAVTKVDFIGMDAPATTEQKADMYSERQGRLHVRIGPHRRVPAPVSQDLRHDDDGGRQRRRRPLLCCWAARRQRRTDGVRRPRRHLADDGRRPVGAGRHRQSAGDGHAVRVQVAAAERRVSTGEFWSKMPAAMGLALLDQDTSSGMLAAKTYTTSTSRASRAAGSTAARRCRPGTLI